VPEADGLPRYGFPAGEQLRLVSGKEGLEVVAGDGCLI